MTGSLLGHAFDHHVWATLRLFDTCLSLDPRQLDTNVPGTYGSIIDTARHIVGADRSYLAVLTREAVPRIDEDVLDLAELRDVMESNGTAWSELLAEQLDADELLTRRREDGSATRAPIGIRLAQALHHGTDHRSQVCTALTTLGVEPPEIDLWDYGLVVGRVEDVAAGA